jgi:hypothetical protein
MLSTCEALLVVRTVAVVSPCFFNEKATPALWIAYLQCLDAIYSVNWQKSGHPRRMSLVTRLLASSEQAWEPMASSSVDFCRKTCTVPRHYVVHPSVLVSCAAQRLSAGGHVVKQIFYRDLGAFVPSARLWPCC